MHHFFLRIYYKLQRLGYVSWIGVVVLFLGLGFLASRIGFEEDITQLIPDSKSAAITQKVLETVSFTDKIVVNLSVTNEDPEALTQYAQEYIDSVSVQLPMYVKNIQGKVAEGNIMKVYDFVYEHLPLFLSEDDYTNLAHKLNADSITNIIENNYKTLLSPAGLITKQYLVKDPLSLTPVGLKKLAQLQLGDNYDLYNGFLVTKDHKNLLLFITPALATNETAENTIFVQQLEQLTTALNTKYETVNAALFGSTLYAVANATQIKQDIQLTISIAMSILLIILVLFYRKITVPLLIFTPTIFGALLAIAILYLWKGQISAISLGIGSVLLGITLDYSLHILTHFRNNRNIETLYSDVSLPILMSSLTTAVAFLCLLFVKSEALNDLGVFAAISVIGASVFALVFIPQAYRFSTQKETSKKTIIDTVSNFNFHTSKIIIGSIVIACCVGLFLFKEVGFNTNLSAMNFQPEGLVKAEADLDRINNNSAKSMYIVSHGTNLNEALNANNNLHQILAVKKSNQELINYSSIGGVVLSQEVQEEKIRIWNSFWDNQRRETAITLLKENGIEKGFKPEAFDSFYTKIKQSYTPIAYQEYKAIKELYLDEFVSEQEGFATVVTAIKVKHENADQIGKALNTQKNTVVIDRKQLNEQLLGNLKNDFNSLISYSLIAVLLLLFFFYKDVVLTLLTAAPIAITWVITLGIMRLLDIDFNIFNVIISTFIFGLGVDYSIFITNGLIKEYEYGVKELHTYKTSILLSVITTVLGIGVLIFAKHPALRSIATVSLIGIITAVMVSFTIQPLLFNACITNRAKKGLEPLQFGQTLLAIWSFGYFIIGGFTVSILSSLLIPWFPVAKATKMSFFHRVVSKLMGSVLTSNPLFKRKIHNPHQEDFSRPCIIIANHASFLDILSVGILHPKLIYLVKDWVYNSKVFGKAVRLAGFYPVSSGIEEGVTHLREKVMQGYSLIAFPEGSRTQTAKMSRFHKGSFYLAEELGIDIVPVIIHGAHKLSPKGDFVIHNGALNIHILPRITQDQTTYGTGYAERTKKISTYCKDQYVAIQETAEGISYFDAPLLNNYRYKKCFNAVKKDLKLHKEQLYTIAKFINTYDTIGVYSNDYGLAAIYLSFKKPYAKCTGVLTSETQLSIAKQCYSTQRNEITFMSDRDLTSNKINVFLFRTNTSISEEVVTALIGNQVQRIIICSAPFELPLILRDQFSEVMNENGMIVLDKNF